MTDNLNLTKTYLVNRTVEIDLNGHNISAAVSTPLFNVNGGNLTIKGNGTVTNTKRVGSASNGGKITLESGNYVSTTDVAFQAVQNGTVVMNGGHISAVEGGIIAPSGRGNIEVNGGTIEVSDNFALATNGSAGRGDNVIVVNGGKLIGNIKSAGYEAIGVYIANNDTFVMNGGEIIANNGTGLCMRAGKVTINDGKITATGEPGKDGKIGDDPTIMEGTSAIIYHESANYPGKDGMMLTINGGTIMGVDHSVQVLSNEEEPQVFVTGGTLNPPYPEN